MRDKKQIKEDLRNILFELKLAKFNEEKKKELDIRHKELKSEYAKAVMEEKKKEK